VPREVAAERIRRRLTAGRDASDATPEVAVAMAAGEAPWPEATSVDTASGPGAALDAAVAVVAAAPTG
jgi:uncharacterized protein